LIFKALKKIAVFFEGRASRNLQENAGILQPIAAKRGQWEYEIPEKMNYSQPRARLATLSLNYSQVWGW
jgi:hypothetical protein